jgi:hypothetical protein
MEPIYTNKHNVSIPLAVFLMFDNYDHDGRTNTISATSIIKPLRQLALRKLYPEVSKSIDISGLVASRMGSAIHDGCEQAWTDNDNITKAFTALGLTKLIPRLQINPTKPLENDEIGVYVEQRHEKPIGDYIITGKYDLVLDGRLVDYKSTSVWGYIYDSNALKYTQQGSIYRWLSPHIIKDDKMEIEYMFTDWSAAEALRKPTYPQLRVLSKNYPLWSESETETYIRDKLAALDSILTQGESGLPLCNSEELWESETVYKYYKNPNNTKRATKNFPTKTEADARHSADGFVGSVVEVKGQVKACRYCDVVGVCSQAKNLVASGRLTLEQ